MLTVEFRVNGALIEHWQFVNRGPGRSAFMREYRWERVQTDREPYHQSGLLEHHQPDGAAALLYQAIERAGAVVSRKGGA